MVKYLLHKHENHVKCPGMVAHDYNPSAGEAEKGWLVNLMESESFGYSESSYLKTKVGGPGGMTRSLGALAAHAEDPNSVSSICIGSRV